MNNLLKRLIAFGYFMAVIFAAPFLIYAGMTGCSKEAKTLIDKMTAKLREL